MQTCFGWVPALDRPCWPRGGIEPGDSRTLPTGTRGPTPSSQMGSTSLDSWAKVACSLHRLSCRHGRTYRSHFQRWSMTRHTSCSSAPRRRTTTSRSRGKSSSAWGRMRSRSRPSRTSGLRSGSRRTAASQSDRGSRSRASAAGRRRGRSRAMARRASPCRGGRRSDARTGTG